MFVLFASPAFARTAAIKRGRDRTPWTRPKAALEKFLKTLVAPKNPAENGVVTHCPERVTTRHSTEEAPFFKKYHLQGGVKHARSKRCRLVPLGFEPRIFRV